MTNEDKALVERLRTGDLCDVELAPIVADRIEALSAENEQLRAELAKRGLEIKEKKDD
jgi:hypothetical protein